MNSKVSVADKLRLFIVFSASAIILITGFDAYLEHHEFAAADYFIAIAGAIAFISVLLLGFSLINMLMKPLHKAIDDLNMESAEAAAASSQVEAASRELAEASLEESASIQETAATLEETSSMIQQNSLNAQEAAILSKDAMRFAEESYVEMQSMVDHMEKLQETSEEIFKIAKVIDNISFQTNILSLNASVEAAKIGREGNAFAVVAEEIRKLSQKTDEASKHIEEILSKNTELVEEGLTFSKDVEEDLSKIDQESKKISSLMDEISVASTEQAKGVNEIHKAIAQMEIAVHSNAHSADECAYAAKDLSLQADYVKDIVNNLNMLLGSDEVQLDNRNGRVRSDSSNYELHPVKLTVDNHQTRI